MYSTAPVDLAIYEERREFGYADFLQRFNNNESVEVCCCFFFSESDSDWFRLGFYEDAIGAIYFLLALCSTTHHRVQLVLGIYHGGNPFALVETGIRDQYTRAEGSFLSRCQFQVLSIDQIPILSTQLTFSHRLLASILVIQFSQTFLIQTIQFSISMQFYLTHR